MSEIIERVAKALAEAHCTSDVDYYVPYAKVAIQAMREPTEEMLDVLLVHKKTYQAMIDEALNE